MSEEQNESQVPIKQADHGGYQVKTRIEVYAADIDEYRKLYGKEEGERRFFAEHTPIDTIEREGNLLMIAGVNAMLTALISTTNSIPFNNANAAIGVGDSTVAATSGQTNLQASTNAFRKAMDATFPTVVNNVLTCKSTFATADANFSWQEWGIFSSVGSGSPPVGGTMFNRKVESLITKSAAASAAFTVTMTIS